MANARNMNGKPKTNGESPDLRDIKKIGRYQILGLLGQGAAGMVYQGWDPFIKRKVAIKMSRPTSELSRESFFVEAQSAGRLSHPNIVSIYDFDVFGEYCYLVMEYVEGTTLEGFCRSDRLLPLPRVSEIVFSVASALDLAHRQGIIHRDIKPSNILLDKDGTTKLTDFGIAQVDDHLDRQVIGTPFYMSPERLRGQTAGPGNDIFALGCVLYELLTGQKAFGGETVEEIKGRILNQEPEPLIRIRPDLPESLWQILVKALAKNPKTRFSSAMDFGYQLRVVLKDITQTVDEAQDFFDYVQSAPFFNHFSKDQIKELVRASNVVRFRKGRVIITEGDQEDSFYVVLSGSVLVKRCGRALAVLSTGECFGEMAVISRSARMATVVADSDCTLIKIGSAVLNRSPESTQLLFFQSFALTLVRRLAGSTTENGGPLRPMI